MTAPANDGGDGYDGPPCTLGEIRCDGNVALTCDGLGGIGARIDCTPSSQTCVENLGCSLCVPGAGTCKDLNATQCLAGGKQLVEFYCDPLQGEACTPDGCKGPCTPDQLGQSYIGCDYWPTVTVNGVYSGFHFAVAVANYTTEPATISVTRNGQTVASQIVSPNGLQVMTLPWVTELKGPDVAEDPSSGNLVPQDPGATALVAGGAYRLRSTQPITVYQFNALEYSLTPAPAACPGTFGGLFGCFSYSNDASLLLPTNTLTADYTAVSWPSAGKVPGFVTVTATADDTQVTVLGSGSFAPGAGVDEYGTGTVSMNAGDVLQLFSAHTGSANDDLSGTRIQASRPVQVIAGHDCANVPNNKAACDHLEEVMFPSETLGTDYLATIPTGPGNIDSPHYVRIVAVGQPATVHFDPASVSADVALSPGDPPLELGPLSEDVRITSDSAILVAEYMEGSQAVPSDKGDPSESIVVPTPQFRKKYIFVTSTTYDSNFVNVIAKTGSPVALDGVPISSTVWTAIGASPYSVARLPVTGQTHTITGGDPFGIVVYGYGEYTSYMYPGGLDLTKITPTPPR